MIPITQYPTESAVQSALSRASAEFPEIAMEIQPGLVGHYAVVCAANTRPIDQEFVRQFLEGYVKITLRVPGRWFDALPLAATPALRLLAFLGLETPKIFRLNGAHPGAGRKKKEKQK